MGRRYPAYMRDRIVSAIATRDLRRQALSQRSLNRAAYARVRERRLRNFRPRVRRFPVEFYDPMDDFMNAEYMF